MAFCEKAVKYFLKAILIKMTDEGTYAIMSSTPDGSGLLSKYWPWALAVLILIIVIVITVVLSSGSHASASTPNAPGVLPNDWTLEGRDDLFVFVKNNMHIGDDCARFVATIVMNNVFEKDYENNKMGVVSDVVITKVPCIGTKGNWSDPTLKGYLSSLLSKPGVDALVPSPLSTGCGTCVAKRIMQDYEPADFILKTMNPSPDLLEYLVKPDPNCNAMCMK